MAYFEDPVRSLKKKKYRLWLRGVTAMAMVVVFITTYMLILPAITLTTPTCGLEEHIHSEDCYETICYNSSGEVISATEAEAIINSKVESANVSPGDETASGSAAETGGTASDGTSEIISERVLTCGLEEHSHTAECYESAETTAETTSSSNSGESSSEKDSGTSDSVLAVADSSEDSSADESESTVSSILEKAEEVTSGGALAIDTATIMEILLGTSGEENPLYVYLTVNGLTYSNDPGSEETSTEEATTEATSEAASETTTEALQEVYTFSGDDASYILEVETVTSSDDVLNYVTDSYNGYYNGLYVSFNVYFRKLSSVTRDADDNVTAYTVGEDTLSLTDAFGSETSLSIKVDYELTSSSVSETDMWAALINTSTDSNNTVSCHSADLTQVKTLSGDTDGVEYAVFDTVTDAFDNSVCFILAKVFAGYVNEVSIYKTDNSTDVIQLVTGTPPFDASEADGNDISASNLVVRSFDVITYSPTVKFQTRSGTGQTGTTSYTPTEAGDLVFTAEMEKSLTEARYNINVSGLETNMGWLSNSGASWYIEYLYVPKDSNGDPYYNEYGEQIECVLMYEDSSGKYTDSSKSDEISVNDLVYGSEGSDSDGTNAYEFNSSSVTVTDEEVQALIDAGTIDASDVEVNCQRLVGTVPLDTCEISSIPGDQTLAVDVYVMASKNGESFAPSFSAYLAKNPLNLGESDINTDQNDENLHYISLTDTNVKQMGISNTDGSTVSTEVGTVFAKASYNFILGNNSSLSYLGNFDLDDGNSVGSITDSDTQLHGRMLGLRCYPSSSGRR
ncbi:MAG: hypothetical protein LUD77_07390 [Clostridiales bacterium]|nr:hypothetical protein [Clostridiales bacterium]